jgi:hypothetical protein
MDIDAIDNLDKFVEYLKEVYPEMYGDPYCGIYIDKGWFSLVDELSRIIYHRAGDEFPRVVQIKEKFGGLRFYADNTNSYADGAIDLAERMSYHICEVCGNRGELRPTSWVRTLCDKHYEPKESTIQHHPV